MNNSNIMAFDLSPVFLNYVKLLENKHCKSNQSKAVQNNQNNASTEFKTQSVKLLENIFNLRSLLESVHEEYISLTPYSEFSGGKRKTMEKNSNDMMKLCKEFLENIGSTKFINSSLPCDIQSHRVAVIEMLKLYYKECEELSKETLHVKKVKESAKNKKLGNIDDTINQTGSVNYSESDFSQKELELLQINADGVYRRLHADLAEKEILEKRLYEIGKMNQTLTENILEQHDLISRLEETTVHSNLNIEYGNDQIKSAMQNQSNMRFWILFILLVLTFALIFVDWYNT